MKVGDKKQAAILTIVAVLALGFLFTQLLPGKRVKFQLPVEVRSAEEKPKASEELPLAVIGNPFSHPKLATKPVLAASPGTNFQPDIDKSGHLTPYSPGPLPDAGGTGDPAETAGNDRQEKQVPRVTLTGLMRVDEPLAMLAVENREAKSYAMGDLVAENARLIAIGDNSVTIRVNGKPRELRMGETLGPKKEQSQ